MFVEHCSKIGQISRCIREEVPWRINFPLILRNDASFPWIIGKFPLQETSSPSLL
jgi:hypothetical protein